MYRHCLTKIYIYLLRSNDNKDFPEAVIRKVLENVLLTNDNLIRGKQYSGTVFFHIQVYLFSQGHRK